MLLSRATAAASAHEKRINLAADRFAQAVTTVNGVLAAAGLGYHLDGDVITSANRRVVLLFCFAVERITLHRRGKEVASALWLRRIDQLNWDYQLLGFSSPGRRQPVVLIDSIEARLVTSVLPAQVAGPERLWGLESRLDPALLRDRVLELTRAELSGVTRAGEAAKLGELLEQRRAIYTALDTKLSERVTPPGSARVELPDRLVEPEENAREIDPLLTPAQRKQLAVLREQLIAPEIKATFAALVEAWGYSVATHEAQHWFDGRARLKMPAALQKRVGPAVDRRGAQRELARVALAETSAYLAQIAADEHFPRVDLALLVGYLFDPQFAGTPESHAALVILETIAKELQAAPAEPLYQGRTVDQKSIAKTYAELAGKNGDQLRRAARAAWKTLFGRELIPLQRVP
jgi:hypothetical protein